VWEQIWIAIVQEFSDLGSVGDITRVLMRMTLAVLLGGLLGYERESVGALAGLRTHMLVSLGDRNDIKGLTTAASVWLAATPKKD
jgi:putative Mg2+ transporter-C (MgtC) family protein